MPPLDALPMSYDAICIRYPRLLVLAIWVAILSPQEAANCIHDHQIARRLGRDTGMGSEAVCHFGGTREVLSKAFRLRWLFRQIEANNKQEPLK